MSGRHNADLEAARDSPQQRVLNDATHSNRTGPQSTFVDGVIKLGGIVLKGIKTDQMPAYRPWRESLRSLFLGPVTWYRAPFVVAPLTLAWVSHFKSDTWGNTTTFVLCFLAMIPLQKCFDLAGDELGLFLGEELRDLLIITLSNAIEAALAVILLFKCQVRLLQSTVIGVVLLHLLLIPGVAFFVEGIRFSEQKLNQPFLMLNLSLLMIGVLGIVTPTAFFVALDRGSVVSGSGSPSGLPAPFVPLVGDAVRRDILQMSRGIAVMLLIIYIIGCLYRQKLIPHAKQGKRNTLFLPSAIQSSYSLAPRDHVNNVYAAEESKEEKLHNPFVLGVLLIVAVALMGVTAEFLVQSIEVILEVTDIQTEWFGLILLPILSFSADGAVAIWKYTGMRKFCCSLMRRAFRRWKTGTEAPTGRRPECQSHSNSLSLTTDNISREGLVCAAESFRHPDSLCTAGHSISQRLTPLDLPGSVDAAAAPSTVNACVQDKFADARKDGGASQERERADVGSQPTTVESEFAHGRPIDLSIQFTLWWTPFLMLLGWWTDRPMHLLFDYFEVGMLLGACFLVNYVTVDEKTNMSEGLTMISFYAMIATAAWFYPGQPQVAFVLGCPGTVAEAVALGPEGTGENLLGVLG